MGTASISSMECRWANRGVGFRESGSRRLPRSGALLQCITPTKPGFMSRFVICTVHFLCSGLNNEYMRQGRCIALPRAAPRRTARGRQERENPRNRGRERNAYAPRLHTNTQPMRPFFCCWGTACSLFFAAGAPLAARNPLRYADWPHGP